MKRAWIPLAILATLCLGAWGHTYYLGQLTGDVSDLLLQAEPVGEADHWEEALSLTEKAYGLWEKKSLYVHITLRHSDTDDILFSFREVLEFLRCQEGGEYSAANAVLLERLYLLQEQEQLTLKNIL